MLVQNGGEEKIKNNNNNNNDSYFEKDTINGIMGNENLITIYKEYFSINLPENGELKINREDFEKEKQSYDYLNSGKKLLTKEEYKELLYIFGTKKIQELLGFKQGFYCTSSQCPYESGKNKIWLVGIGTGASDYYNKNLPSFARGVFE